MYYVLVEDNKIIGCGEFECSTETIINVEVPKDLYDAVVLNREKYMYLNGDIVLNPNYEDEQATKREAEFNKDFFNTSLGWIRRKVSMKTNETKDFLTDLLPVISLGVQSGQTVNIITYTPPDFYQEVVDWESLQTVRQATPQFIQECFAQVSKDFTGV